MIVQSMRCIWRDGRPRSRGEVLREEPQRREHQHLDDDHRDVGAGHGASITGGPDAAESAREPSRPSGRLPGLHSSAVRPARLPWRASVLADRMPAPPSARAGAPARPHAPPPRPSARRVAWVHLPGRTLRRTVPAWAPPDRPPLLPKRSARRSTCSTPAWRCSARTSGDGIPARAMRKSSADSASGFATDPAPHSVTVPDGAWTRPTDSRRRTHSQRIAVEEQPDRIRSRTAASRRSIVRPYESRTFTTVSANQHRFRSGSHSAASFAPFSSRFSPGLASVRFSQVAGEPFARGRIGSAESAVMRLGSSDDVLDVRFPRRVERLARIGAVDPAEAKDDPRLDALRVAVVVAVVGRTAVFFDDPETTPRCPRSATGRPA